MNPGAKGIAVMLALLGFLAISSLSRAQGEVPIAAREPLESATIERAPSSNFPDPVIEPLHESMSFEGTSLTLTPLSMDLPPMPIDGLAAVQIAEGEFGPSAFPTKVTASLALDRDGTAVWAIFFDGICVPIFGPPSREADPSGCASNTLIVIVDATNGQVYGAITP